MTLSTRKGGIWLSSHALSVMEKCPRCFWIEYNHKIKRPEWFRSRLTNRFDGVIKAYFNIYREKGILPPIIEGKVEGKLVSPFKSFRAFHYTDKFGFTGTLDECLITLQGEYIPVDHKTSSVHPREKHEIFASYQNQLDAYDWLLRENGSRTAGFGYLIAYYPSDSELLHNGFPMVVHVEKVKTNPENAKQKFYQAVEMLEGPMPNSAEICEFCIWHRNIGDILNGKLITNEVAIENSLESGIPF